MTGSEQNSGTRSEFQSMKTLMLSSQTKKKNKEEKKRQQTPEFQESEIKEQGSILRAYPHLGCLQLSSPYLFKSKLVSEKGPEKCDN